MNRILERALPFIELQADEVAAIISPVVQAAPEELKITPLSGSLNTSFRVTHSSRDLMVRLITGDLNADGDPEVIAGGRATHNLKIYWNRTRSTP